MGLDRWMVGWGWMDRDGRGWTGMDGDGWMGMDVGMDVNGWMDRWELMYGWMDGRMGIHSKMGMDVCMDGWG